MKKQTAVEWFQDQIIKIVNGTCELSETQIFEQAKAMEKEQISNAYVYGSCYGIDLDKGLNPNNYFIETYKKGEQ